MKKKSTSAATKEQLDLAYEVGFEDGAEMARESGSADPGPDGWDGLLINAIGYGGACELLGLPAAEGREDMTDTAWELLAAYSQGAQDGAGEEVQDGADEEVLAGDE